MAYSSSPTLLFLLLPLLSHAYQTCPDQVDYRCPDFKGTSVMFPFTNTSFRDCGFCVLECKNRTNTTLQSGQQQLSYNTKQIFLDNNTMVLEYPGLHKLISNVCSVQQSDSPILPTPPLTTFEILNQIVYFRCGLDNTDPPPAQKTPFTNCGDGNKVYGPYAADRRPKGIPTDCREIMLPNSTNDDFSMVYHLPDECSVCAHDRSRCHDHNTGKHKCPEPGNRILEVILFSSFSGAAAIVVLLVICWRRRKLRCSSTFPSTNQFKKDNKIFETVVKSYASHTPKSYTYSEIKKMTNSFGEKLGEGGFGGVYKGKLLDGRLVAVKLLKNSKGEGEGFVNEVASIGRTNHVNIVTLLGFCFEGHKRALVYEYMANGSLEKFRQGNANNGQTLPFETLFQIVLGIARGLEYLHRGCKTRILHFDIKPHNILLDEDFCPKISDFGLAKLTPRDKQSKISMSGARGTIGYIAPEVFCRNLGDVSHKSDVYSYGMMVLEMIGSRNKASSDVESSSDIYFPQWIYKELENEEEVDTGITMDENHKKLKRKMIVVSLWCIQVVPSSRPSMSRVVQMLEGRVESIDVPPVPEFPPPPSVQWDPSCTSSILSQT